MKLSISMTKTEWNLGWLFLVAQLLVLPVALVMANQLLGSPLSVAELNFVLFVINFLLTLAIFHRFLWSSLRLSLCAPFRYLRAAFLGFAAYYLLSFLVGIFIQTVYPAFSNVNDENIILMSQDGYTLMAVGTILLVPITEETLYRGLVFRGLHSKSRLAAYAVSTAVFAFIHIAGYIGAAEPIVLLLCFLQYIPAGLTLAWAYERADSIWAPILMHIAINQIGMSSMR